MADRPLARPFLLSRQLLSRRPLSLVSRAFSLVNNVRRQHRPMANPRLRLALVQRSPVIPMASSSQSGSSWRQAQMVWLGKAISYEQGVEDLPMPAPVRVPSPGAATRPAVARRTAEIPAPPAQFSPRARPRVAVQASPQPTPTVDAPPGVEAPEQESGGLVRGSDMWQRLFPERSSFLQGIREKDVARKQERTMKRPPPVIPSKLPRTRTWEITPVELAKPAVPVSPPSAAVDQTIARDPEDASQAPEPEEDARTSPRAGPPKADSAAVQRLSAAAEPSAAVKRDLYDVRQGQDDRPAEPDGVSVVEEATGVDVRLSHPAPAVDRKVEAASRAARVQGPG